ncbi:MAG: Mu transposase C-terminal domain-containing protein [Acidobacteria bacterium]|nr:Mu transposase C-terminal domain-containing protein [Acidobacteriota bacterium]
MTSKKRGRRLAPHGGYNPGSVDRTALDAMELLPNGISPDIFANEDMVRAVPRADALKGKQLEEVAVKYRLVCLVANGRSPRQALEHLRSEHPVLEKRTERWAQKLIQNYKKHGVVALLDHRRNRTNEARVLTSVVKKIALCWFFARPAACYSLIAKTVAIECSKRDIPSPSYSAIKKYLGSLPEYFHLIRKGGIKAWDKKGKPVVRINITSYANQRWQIDHSRLDIWVRVWDGEKWVPSQVWLSLVLDAHTRAIPGFVLSTKYPDAWTVALLMRHAILPKENLEWKVRGIPEVVQPDNGRDFRSHAVEVSFAYLKIRLEFDPPYYPNMKGKIERFFLTLDRGCLRVLPGHMDATGRSETSAMYHILTLLTRQQLNREIEKYIVDEYHQRTHSETGRKPAEYWEQAVRLRMPESVDALNRMLLKFEETRKVNNVGVSFMYKERGGDYWAPALVELLGSDVQIRFNPEDLQSILLYDKFTEEYICEAWLMGQPNSKYTHEDVKAVRNQFRAGLVDRFDGYAKEVQEKDRRAAQKAEWEEAKRLVEESSDDVSTVAGLDEAEMDAVNDFLDRLEREARDED